MSRTLEQQLAARHRQGLIFEWACRIITWSALGMLALLLGSIFWKAAGWIDWRFLTSFDKATPLTAGIVGGLVGSFWLILITMLLTVPIGVAAAIYLEEYAKPGRMTRFIQLNIANLAGVPSVVYGILGLGVFVHMFGMPRQPPLMLNLYLLKIPFQLPFGKALISGGLTLTLLSLPVVIIATQEALRSVPASIRHASLALGATKWQTIWYQVLPAAVPSILTGVILAMSRALGETAPLVVLGVASHVDFVPGNFKSMGEVFSRPDKLAAVPFGKFSALPLQIYSWANQNDKDYQHVAAAGIVVLLAALLLLNGTAIYIRNHFQKKIRW